MGGSESVTILGVQGIIIMWQLVFASCHRLKSKKKKNKKKGCLMVMADPSDHGHRKNVSVIVLAAVCKIGEYIVHLEKVIPCTCKD